MSVTLVAASGPIDISVKPSKVPAGQPFKIYFTINSPFAGQAVATVEIGTCSACSDIWKSEQLGVYSGQSYDVNPPVINTLGSYIVTVLVMIPGPMGGAAIRGSATFQIVASTSRTQTVSSTNAITQTETSNSATASGAPFDFSISVSPTEQGVVPGRTAACVVMVNLVSGEAMRVRLRITDLAAGMNASFDPQSGKPPYNSLLTVSTTQSVSAGRVAMTVTGTGGGNTRTASFTLIVGLEQMQTKSSQNLSNSSQPSQAASFMAIIQQNGLIIIGALVVLVIIIALALKGRKPKSISKPGSTPSSTLCAN